MSGKSGRSVTNTGINSQVRVSKYYYVYCNILLIFCHYLRVTSIPATLMEHTTTRMRVGQATSDPAGGLGFTRVAQVVPRHQVGCPTPPPTTTTRGPATPSTRTKDRAGRNEAQSS